MRLTEHAMFPTFVYSNHMRSCERLNERAVERIQRMRSEDGGPGLGRSSQPELGGWHSPNDLHLQDPFLDIVTLVEAFASNIHDRPLLVSSIWAIVNPPGAGNKSHVHPGSLWSGVYYFQVP